MTRLSRLLLFWLSFLILLKLVIIRLVCVLRIFIRARRLSALSLRIRRLRRLLHRMVLAICIFLVRARFLLRLLRSPVLKRRIRRVFSLSMTLSILFSRRRPRSLVLSRLMCCTIILRSVCILPCRSVLRVLKVMRRVSMVMTVLSLLAISSSIIRFIILFIILLMIILILRRRILLSFIRRRIMLS